MSAPHPRTIRLVALGLVGCALAACTSDGDDGRKTTPATSGPASAATITTAVPPGSSSPAPGFDGLDATLLVAGPSRDRADVYRISSGRILRVTRSARVIAIGSGGGHTVVGVRTAQDTQAVRELRASRLVSLPGTGFDPAVSESGALATVHLDGGSTTPGVTKPDGFVLSVRDSVSAKDRVVLRTTASMGSPRWTSERTVVVAVATGNDAQVVRVDTRTGRRTDLGRVSGAGDLELTAGSRAISVATDDGAVLLATAGGAQHPFPRGWTPLCWPSSTTALATRSGRLATVSLTPDGTAGSPRVLGPLPVGTSAYAAACGN